MQKNILEVWKTIKISSKNFSGMRVCKRGVKTGETAGYFLCTTDCGTIEVGVDQTRADIQMSDIKCDVVETMPELSSAAQARVSALEQHLAAVQAKKVWSAPGDRWGFSLH